MRGIGKILLVVVVLELALGGGGRLIDAGPLSPRMWLFVGAAVYVAFMLCVVQSRIPWEFACFILAFCALVSFNGVISIVRQQPFDSFAEDLKPQLYFPMLAFFAITIRNREDVEMVSKLLKGSAVLLAVAYLFALSAWHSGMFTFQQVQGLLNPTGDPRKEFYFRAETTFFFKAVLYVAVGWSFFVFSRRLAGKLVAAVLFMAIFFTLTRGLVAALFLSLATWFLFFHPNRLRGAGLAVMNAALGLLAVLVVNHLAPTAEASLQVRVEDVRTITAVVAGISSSDPEWALSTLVAGTGLGSSIGGRRQIEMNYVEILYKQGLIGLAFWLLPIVYMTLRMLSLRTSAQRTEAAPYYLAALVVYFESITNPFLTNPIGMSVVLIGMVALRALTLHELTEGSRISAQPTAA